MACTIELLVRRALGKSKRDINLEIGPWAVDEPDCCLQSAASPAPSFVISLLISSQPHRNPYNTLILFLPSLLAAAAPPPAPDNLFHRFVLRSLLAHFSKTNRRRRKKKGSNPLLQRTGTSADQDTRFSNKEAKLLKSQKFAAELDHSVDMTKVKMDVIRPWIANRVTEFLGFEDEVLINFIYGLLDGKDVDGKQVQIQLTGFMEKNTGKFMKELWTLLLSAQKNVSGVPQQFLDAKEEETRKKKVFQTNHLAVNDQKCCKEVVPLAVPAFDASLAKNCVSYKQATTGLIHVEADRITHEIQIKKEKEGREVELAKQKKMDGEGDISRSVDGASNAIGRHSVPRSSSFGPEERRDVDGRHDSRGRSRLEAINLLVSTMLHHTFSKRVKQQIVFKVKELFRVCGSA
ncbi:hypothetical protein ACLOJK_012693 [Asimina triloba]